MKYILPLISLFALTFALNASVVFDFEGNNGQHIKAPASNPSAPVSGNSGTSSGEWNFGGPMTQNGALNIGYTNWYKWKNVDDSEQVIRTYTLDNALSTGEYSFLIEIDSFDLTRSWDVNNTGQAQKGMQYILRNASGEGISINLYSFLNPITQQFGTQISSGDYNSSFGSTPGNSLFATTSDPITLKIDLNLDNGNWSSSAKLNSDAEFTLLSSGGTGFTEIKDLQIAAVKRASDAWGDPSIANGSYGDFVRVGLMSLTSTVSATSAYKDIKAQSAATYNASQDNITGTRVTDYLGDLNLSNSGQGVTYQIAVDTNTGEWASRVRETGAGTWTNLVTDGTGIYSISDFQISSKTESGGAWGDDTVAEGSTGDFIKIDDVSLKSYPFTLVQDDAATTDTNEFSLTLDAGGATESLVEFGFNGSAGTALIGSAEIPDDPATTEVNEFVAAVPSSANEGTQSGTWNFGGWIEDGSGNVGVGYVENNRWVNGIEGNVFRTFTLDQAITTAGQYVFEVKISSYDLSRSWDAAEGYNGSNRGIQVNLRNAAGDAYTDTDGNPATTLGKRGAAIELYSDNQQIEGALVQLDFDDEEGTNLKDTSNKGTNTGAWSNGGPRTNADGNIVIGFGETNKWVSLDDNTTATEDGNAYRTYTLDEAITTGRYIFEARLDSYDLDKSWAGGTATPNKGMQFIVKQTDGSGATINVYSHLGGQDDPSTPDINEAGTLFQVKAQSNRFGPAEGTAENVDGQKQAFGLDSDGPLFVQFQFNLETGQWSSRARSNPNGDWKPMVTTGTGITSIQEFQINSKTPAGDSWGNDPIADNPNTPDLDETDAGTALGDFVNLDYIRIFTDSGPDQNNNIHVIGNTWGNDTNITGDLATVITNNYSQAGSNVTLKIKVDLDNSTWESSFKTGDATEFTALTNGTGITSVSRIMMNPKNPQNDAWGTEAQNVGGVTGDYVKINNIAVNEVDADGTILSSYVNMDFDVVASKLTDDGNGSPVVQNSGSKTGSVWNFGGPMTHDGNLNIGYPEYYKWSGGVLGDSFRKYIIQDTPIDDPTTPENEQLGGAVESPITSGIVELVVDWTEYDLSKTWDETSNSGTGKGMQFALTDANDSGAVVNFFTQNNAPEPPPDTTAGHYVLHDFDEAAGTQINQTTGTGSLDRAFNFGATKVDGSGNLVWGYGPSQKVSQVNGGGTFRTKHLTEILSTGTIVYEAVVTEADLSKDWEGSDDPATDAVEGRSEDGKGWRMILKMPKLTATDGTGVPNDPNVTGSGARHGAAINIYAYTRPDADGNMVEDLVVTGQTWNGDGQIISEGMVEALVGETDQKFISDPITLQMVIDLDTGFFYQRFKRQSQSEWTPLIQEGIGFNHALSIQLANNNPPNVVSYDVNGLPIAGASSVWGGAGQLTDGVNGDYVKIGRLAIRDQGDEPDPGAPTDTDGDGEYDIVDLDDDGDGIYDAAETFTDANSNGLWDEGEEYVDANSNGLYDLADAFPLDATETKDSDGDGIGDNADPTPNGDTPVATEAPVPSVSVDGNTITVTWDDTSATLDGSADLSSDSWSEAATSSPHTEAVSGSKFFRTTTD